MLGSTVNNCFWEKILQELKNGNRVFLQVALRNHVFPQIHAEKSAFV